MLIAFEGIPKSGKSTLSLALLEYLNNKFKTENNLLRVDPHLGDFIWTKEPTFPDDHAHSLNIEGINECRRERIFFESRIKHQEVLMGRNIVCERYLWGAYTYIHKYSPSTLNILKELYSSDYIFVQPDLYFFVDTNPEVCYERDKETDVDRLLELRNSYLYTQQFINEPVITITSIGSESRAVDEMILKFDKYVKDKEFFSLV